MNINTEDRLISSVGAEVIRQELVLFLRATLRAKKNQGQFMKLLAESLASETIGVMLEGITLRVPKAAADPDSDFSRVYAVNSGDSAVAQAELRRMLADVLVYEVQGYTGPGGDGAPSDYTQP